MDDVARKISFPNSSTLLSLVGVTSVIKMTQQVSIGRESLSVSSASSTLSPDIKSTSLTGHLAASRGSLVKVLFRVFPNSLFGGGVCEIKRRDSNNISSIEAGKVEFQSALAGSNSDQEVWSLIWLVGVGSLVDLEDSISWLLGRLKELQAVQKITVAFCKQKSCTEAESEILGRLKFLDRFLTSCNKKVLPFLKLALMERYSSKHLLGSVESNISRGSSTADSNSSSISSSETLALIKYFVNIFIKSIHIFMYLKIVSVSREIILCGVRTSPEANSLHHPVHRVPGDMVHLDSPPNTSGHCT
ncbi:hypothetical protein M5K25_009408 [Dendrobium thyrsiflorum]|uniref:Uncharacterized protein n=1 Tax=Dendrobium thyrsiflorum TaxID=117978 RepID=A0ABD0V502_DENTH